MPAPKTRGRREEASPRRVAHPVAPTPTEYAIGMSMTLAQSRNGRSGSRRGYGGAHGQGNDPAHQVRETESHRFWGLSISWRDPLDRPDGWDEARDARNLHRGSHREQGESEEDHHEEAPGHGDPQAIGTAASATTRSPQIVGLTYPSSLALEPGVTRERNLMNDVRQLGRGQVQNPVRHQTMPRLPTPKPARQTYRPRAFVRRLALGETGRIGRTIFLKAWRRWTLSRLIQRVSLIGRKFRRSAERGLSTNIEPFATNPSPRPITPSP